MKSIVLNVEGMSCSHCEKAITGALGKIDGVEEVKVDIEGKTVSVTFNESKIELDRINAAIEDQGYDVLRT
jgi:copper chaperone